MSAGPLQDFTDQELRAELHDRDEARKAEEWRALRARFGPCPTCGAEIVGLANDVVNEEWTAEGWEGWPIPPPPDWHQRRRVLTEYATTLSCGRGHSWEGERSLKIHK